jgi:hypothetical protein
MLGAREPTRREGAATPGQAFTAYAARRRQARTLRHEGRHSRRTERDIWLLEVLAKMRFLTTRQVAKLAFRGSRPAAQKRLRKLLDAGMVRVWVRDLAKDNVYGLARRGAGILGASDGQHGARVPRGLEGNLDHLLAINQVRISIALGLDVAGGELVWWRSDWELRGRLRSRLVPDAVFAVRWEGKDQAFALEVDYQSRSSRTFLGKLIGYASLMLRGGDLLGVSDFLVLVVVSDGRWLGRYLEAVEQARMGGRVWFASLEALRDGGGEASSWRTLDREGYSLRMVANLLYGREGSKSKTPSMGGTYAASQSTEIPL